MNSKTEIKYPTYIVISGTMLKGVVWAGKVNLFPNKCWRYFCCKLNLCSTKAMSKKPFYSMYAATNHDLENPTLQKQINVLQILHISNKPMSCKSSTQHQIKVLKIIHSSNKSRSGKSNKSVFWKSSTQHQIKFLKSLKQQQINV